MNEQIEINLDDDFMNDQLTIEYIYKGQKKMSEYSVKLVNMIEGKPIVFENSDSDIIV